MLILEMHRKSLLKYMLENFEKLQSQDLPIELMNKSMKYLIANCKVYMFWYYQIMPNYVSFIEF